MNFLKKLDNVFVIDTRMFGFEHYQSSYIVAGDENIMIDTGIPASLEAVQKGIREHGFSIKDISRIFLTHCEHPDHAGNVGTFIKENPGLKVYINPIGLEYMTHPEVESENRKKVMLPQMAARFGTQLPVPTSQIHFLKDGEEFDIGRGERLKIMFNPGHQPSGLVIFESKYKGLFINDLVGNYFTDADFSLVLTPPRSDVIQAREALIKFAKMDISRLYMGHYGINLQPQKVIQRTLEGINRITGIADRCLKAGKPEAIEAQVLASKMPEVEKLKAARGEVLYEYVRDELITHHSTYFAQYYLNLVKGSAPLAAG